MRTKASCSFYVNLNNYDNAKKLYGRQVDQMVDQFLFDISTTLNDDSDYEYEEVLMKEEEAQQKAILINKELNEIKTKRLAIEENAKRKAAEKKIEEKKQLELLKQQDLIEEAKNKSMSIEEFEFILKFKESWNDKIFLEEKVKQYNARFSLNYSIEHLKIRIDKLRKPRKVRQ